MGNTVIKLDIPASHKHLNILGASLGALFERVDFLTDREMLTYNMELALHETCTNIVEHAYESKENGRIRVTITLSESDRELIVDLYDNGKSFNLDEAKEPNLEEVQIRGYGLFLMRQLLDEVVYKPGSKENYWHLVKKL